MSVFQDSHPHLIQYSTPAQLLDLLINSDDKPIKQEIISAESSWHLYVWWLDGERAS
jgi:hypothetical protein